MPTPSEKLAQSLEALRSLQDRGSVALRADALSRTHRERLLKNGFLSQIMKGWFIAVNPDDSAGESTAWYTAFWPFCAAYLQERFATGWCLSPEQSLLLHAGNWTIPRQLLVRSPKARNQVTQLLHDTSLLDVRAALPQVKDIETIQGLRVFALHAALISTSTNFFKQQSLEIRTALSLIRDSSELLGNLLDGGHSVVAGRLAGAFRNIGRIRIADDILKTMRDAGFSVRESNPFATQAMHIEIGRERSPYVHRIRLMWKKMREEVVKRFPQPQEKRIEVDAYLQHIAEVYVTDAYNSLSIEGYFVSPQLIERVRSGKWNPETDRDDRTHRDALAARGYWQAFQTVRDSVRRVLRKENPGTVSEEDHRTWYRELFAPSITAGLLSPADLAGYRNDPVYIRTSRHVPPSSTAVRDSMPVLFELLSKEKEPSVRVVLSHFVFVYIHPYMDGNGRMGRFLMNVMLAAGGYPWTIIPVEKRATYMAALEAASVQQNIVPFTDFLAGLVKREIKGKSSAKILGK